MKPRKRGKGGPRCSAGRCTCGRCGGAPKPAGGPARLSPAVAARAASAGIQLQPMPFEGDGALMFGRDILYSHRMPAEQLEQLVQDRIVELSPI